MGTEKRVGTEELMKVDPKGFKRSVIDIGIVLSIGALFLLSSFLIPDLSKGIQILFWQTAMLFFFITSMFIRMHLREFY